MGALDGLSNGPIPDPHVAQTEGSQIGDHRLSTSCASSSDLITIVVMTFLKIS